MNLWAVAFAAVALAAPLALHAAKPGDTGKVLDGYADVEAVEQRLAATPMHVVEGVWRFPADGGTMAVVRDTAQAGDVYLMVALRAADRSVRPGTVMGWLTATARRGVYDARVYTRSDDTRRVLFKPKKYLATLDDGDTRLVMKEYGHKLEFRWWNLFPYMYRRVLRRTGSVPDDLGGCVRLFPEPLPPTQPRYL